MGMGTGKGKGPGRTPRWLSAALAALVVVALLVPAMAGGARAETGGDGAPGAPSLSAPDQPFRQWLPAALAGDAMAQYAIGRAFAESAVTRADLAEAARWYRQAADRGNARAQNDLAMLYTKGLGVTQDYVQAYVWFDVAAARFGAGRRHDQAIEMRDMMGAFLTPGQFAEANRLSKEKLAQLHDE